MWLKAISVKCCTPTDRGYIPRDQLAAAPTPTETLETVAASGKQLLLLTLHHPAFKLLAAQ
jgi:hypothetical protein